MSAGTEAGGGGRHGRRRHTPVGGGRHRAVGGSRRHTGPDGPARGHRIAEVVR
ncbi:hypothetical protein [Streptomyces sp. AA1529]|uniref:hypothetical protein n=1 Tax=Streptomyces sp. AA1529 TaxID=1203257 RepID=UPI0003663672|nr:hypothetical protein [Streptomyces sp. AA1529]